ncbi:MAG: ankyrin repeat domain-containing protein [Anaerolineae bacterium]|nr:ankyrin repeat domain-containing protein [Anaerolineae bacterium]MCI0610045.1 ankyrin repeat domain-containing protein [Anaerolineae bacterium]
MNVLQRKQELLDAVKKADLPLLDSLLREGGDVNAIYPNGKTLLIAAVEAQKREIVEYLVQAGANLNQRDFYDRTPLMYAADQEDISIARILIDAGADVNAKNKQGRTALMYAAYKDSLEMTEVLLNVGADMNARDRKDRSALNYSAYKKSRKCHDLLVARGAETREPGLQEASSGFAAMLRNTLTMDEFTELKKSPVWTCGSVVASYLLILLMSGLQFACGPFTWILILGAAWSLLISFPSILKIYTLGREVLQMRSGKSIAAVPANMPPEREIKTPGDTEFVSYLMELGSRELASIHLTHPDDQSPRVKLSLFYSRVISVFLAFSIFIMVLAFFWPGVSRMNADFLLSNSALLGRYILIGLALPLWIWIACITEYRLRVRRLHLIQKDRDRIAGEIAKLLNAEEFRDKQLPSDFGLYLRAFMTTDKLHIKGFDLETMLAYSIAPTLPLLALGKPGEHLGSGRIQTTDEHWQEEILRLMDAARLILIIPSHRSGTLWEISTLRERGYFDRTIFIMPPELGFHGGKYSEDWQKTVSAAREVGVEFPVHISVGAFFRLNESGEFEDFAPFVSEEFLQEFEPQGGSGNQGSDYDSTNPDGDGEADSSDGIDGVDVDGGADGGDGGLAADGIDGGYGGNGGSGGDGGGGNGGGGDGGGGNGGGSG